MSYAPETAADSVIHARDGADNIICPLTMTERNPVDRDSARPLSPPTTAGGHRAR
jgi:hypothetical protein